MKIIKTISFSLATVSALAQTAETPAVTTTPVAPAPATQPFSEKMHERYAKEGLKVYLSNDSSQWLKATVVAQVWLRDNDNNPGSTIFGYPERETQDAGLRRLRFQLFGPVTKYMFVYVQFGMNNFNYVAPRKQNAFFHDAVAEYKVYKKYLSIGAGLTTFGGPQRYAAPAVGSILMADAPIYQQTTTDQTDQFGRKVGMYLKGQIGRFDYRVAVGKPMPVESQVPVVASVATTTTFDTAYSTAAKFSPLPPQLQYQAYLKWHFLEKESNDLPYNPGTYLGKKRMLTLGAGVQYQAAAVRYWDSSAVPLSAAIINSERAAKLVYHDLFIAGVDLFYDSYLNKEKGNAISAYGAFSYADYGLNYLRYNGVMNPTTGINTSVANLNSKANGSAFPMMGTGTTEFLQLAYKFRNDLLKKRGTLQPYFGVQVSQYQALQYDNMVVADMGLNWLVSGNNRISLNYQSRPVYELNTTTKNYVNIPSARRGMVYLQYQISL